MLILPIKKKWYNMILSGEKKEEYREIKPYYDSRLLNEFGMFKDGNKLIHGNTFPPEVDLRKWICFRNGYSAKSPSFKALCTLSIGKGHKSWGAEEYKDYYVLSILDIEEE